MGKVPKQLTPFKKGDPNINRTGLNKGSVHLKARLKEALLQIGKGNTESYEVLFIQRLLKKAIVDGDHPTMKLIWETLEGKATETHDVSGNFTIRWLRPGEKKKKN